jgi:hypothetical protein
MDPSLSGVQLLIVQSPAHKFRQRVYQAVLLLVFLAHVGMPHDARGSVSRQDETDIRTFAGGIALMFDSIPAQRRDPSSDMAFAVVPGDALRGRLRVISRFEKPVEVEVKLLLNYRPASFALDPIVQPELSEEEAPTSLGASTAGFAQRAQFTAQPGVELRFRFRTEALEFGYYDLAMVVVTDPESLPSQMGYSTSFRPTLRHSLYVGDAQLPLVQFEPIDLFAVPNPGFDELCFFSSDPYSLDRWPGRSAKPGELVRFFLNIQPHPDTLVNSVSEVSTPIALVGFFDGQVIQLGDQDIVYGLVRPGYLSTLEITLEAPSDPGTYQFFVQQFPQPFLNPDEKKELSLYADSSQRIVIQVAPE